MQPKGVFMQDRADKEENTTVNFSTTIEGNLEANEHLIVNGTIQGNVDIKTFDLFLNPSGRLEGDVHAQNVRIQGYMRGDIKATGKVEIAREANFSGKINSKWISLEKADFFDTYVDLGQKILEIETKKKPKVNGARHLPSSP